MVHKVLTEFRVGLFVVAGLLLAMIIIFMIGGEKSFFQRQYTIYANFEDISGLRVGAPVQLAGLRVGLVDKILFPEDISQRMITVVLKVEKKYQRRIRGDSIATIETQGLLGDKFIYISMGGETQPPIPDRGIVPSKETVSIFSLADKAGRIMDDIGEAASSINEMLTTVHGKKENDLKAVISSIRKSLEQIEKGKGMLHALIYDPKGEEMISNLADSLKLLRDTTVAATEKGTKGETVGLLTNLRYASADLRKILDSVRRGEGSLGRLVNDPGLYNELASLLGRASRNRLLRAVIRQTINENERQTVTSDQ